MNDESYEDRLVLDDDTEYPDNESSESPDEEAEDRTSHVRSCT